MAASLGVADETYRTWDSGRRRTPDTIIYKARRLADTDGGRLLPLPQLASEFDVHVRTLRKAGYDGRLAVTYSARMAFGRQVAFAAREDVATFKRRYYCQTNQWNRPSPPTACVVPDDYDQVLIRTRLSLRLTQAVLAARIDAAGKAVIYQWESRRRRPSPLFWRRLQELIAASGASDADAARSMEPVNQPDGVIRGTRDVPFSDNRCGARP